MVGGVGWMSGSLDYLRLKPAQPPIGVGAWAELGNNYTCKAQKQIIEMFKEGHEVILPS